MGELLAPTGEETPFYRKAGLGIFHGLAYSDAITAPPPEAALERAGELLLRDTGLRTDACLDREALARAFLDRLELQWPGCLPGEKRRLREEELQERLRALPPGQEDWRSVYLAWIVDLQAQGFPVDPSLFSASSHHPSALPLLEEPPYVSPEPKRALTREMAEELPLLLKTSTNAYRIPFLRALFPRASFRWIVLQRNPAAAASALMDGWLSSAFHAHDLHPHAKLNIRGYSDRVPGGGRYWKFDMPPGWQAYRDSDLADLCAFQWHSAYQAIGGFLEKCQEPAQQVRYEDLLSPGRHEDVLRELIAFSGASCKTGGAWSHGEPVVTVEAPLPGKWKKRAAEIETALRSHQGGELLAASRRMGYDPEHMELWP